MELHQTPKLLQSKENNRMKRHLTEWKKISASYLSDKRLISIIYQELKNSVPKSNQSSEQMNKDLKRGNINVQQIYEKTISLVTGEKQIKLDWK